MALARGVNQGRPIGDLNTPAPLLLTGSSIAKLKALYCPSLQTDWLLSETKAYTRTIFLDSQGGISITYMEPKWIPQTRNGEDPNREQFVYLLCTHLTLHLVCILLGPNYWDFVWRWGPVEEATLSLEEKKTHPGAWALFADDWQNRMFGPLRTCFFRPDHTWKNVIKSPGNAGTKGEMTAFHGYLHMNAYPVFCGPRLQTHSADQQEKMDRGKISPTFIKALFGKNIVPNVCYSTAKLMGFNGPRANTCASILTTRLRSGIFSTPRKKR